VGPPNVLLDQDRTEHFETSWRIRERGDHLDALVDGETDLFLSAGVSDKQESRGVLGTDRFEPVNKFVNICAGKGDTCELHLVDASRRLTSHASLLPAPPLLLLLHRFAKPDQRPRRVIQRGHYPLSVGWTQRHDRTPRGRSLTQSLTELARHQVGEKRHVILPERFPGNQHSPSRRRRSLDQLVVGVSVGRVPGQRCSSVWSAVRDATGVGRLLAVHGEGVAMLLHGVLTLLAFFKPPGLLLEIFFCHVANVGLADAFGASRLRHCYLHASRDG